MRFYISLHKIKLLSLAYFPQERKHWQDICVTLRAAAKKTKTKTSTKQPSIHFLKLPQRLKTLSTDDNQWLHISEGMTQTVQKIISCQTNTGAALVRRIAQTLTKTVWQEFCCFGLFFFFKSSSTQKMPRIHHKTATTLLVQTCRIT